MNTNKKIVAALALYVLGVAAAYGAGYYTPRERWVEREYDVIKNTEACEALGGDIVALPVQWWRLSYTSDEPRPVYFRCEIPTKHIDTD